MGSVGRGQRGPSYYRDTTARGSPNPWGHGDGQQKLCEGVRVRNINSGYLSGSIGCSYLETECRLFPPVTIFLDLFPRAGYFFNALY